MQVHLCDCLLFGVLRHFILYMFAYDFFNHTAYCGNKIRISLNDLHSTVNAPSIT